MTVILVFFAVIFLVTGNANAALVALVLACLLACLSRR